MTRPASKVKCSGTCGQMVSGSRTRQRIEAVPLGQRGHHEQPGRREGSQEAGLDRGHHTARPPALHAPGQVEADLRVLRDSRGPAFDPQPPSGDASPGVRWPPRGKGRS